jgi:hypothetical protein
MNRWRQLLREPEMQILLWLIAVITLSAPYAIGYAQIHVQETTIFLFGSWCVLLIVLVLLGHVERASTPELDDPDDEQRM